MSARQLDEYPVVRGEKNSVGIVEPKCVRLFDCSNVFRLENGEELFPIDVVYETYGKLNEEKDNVILILHALTGSAHAAGYHKKEGHFPGWWNSMIGPKKTFDTDKYFVVSPNILGSCYGTTGPSSINPKTGKPYGSSFPVVSIKDMVGVQKVLMDYLGIEKLFCVVGGSMGGMQALEWALSYPDRVENLILLATSARTSPFAIAIHKVGIEAIVSDPNWRGGDYYEHSPPVSGLGIARMIGHISYLSDEAMWKSFGRNSREEDRLKKDINARFEVERYLDYQTRKFVNRFDANSYIYIMRAMDTYDASSGYESLEESFSRIMCKRVLVVSFSHDWLFPPYQSEEIVSALKANNIAVRYECVYSPYGHDSFLIEHEKLKQIITSFYSSDFS